MSEKGTEQATPQRKKKAKDKGDGVRSKELLSAAAMLGGVIAFGILSQKIPALWREIYVQSLHLAITADPNNEHVWSGVVQRLLWKSAPSLGLVSAASITCVMVAGIVQNGGLHIYVNSLQPKFSRLNPSTNLKNLFSMRTVARLVKSTLPVLMMTGFAWKSLHEIWLSMPTLSLVRLPEAFVVVYSLTKSAAWVMLFWSAIDYAVEWRSWNSRLKMTKQEIREEMKETMGNPEIKGKIRQIQNAMRRRKVKADISRATLVITNPTHYAVALMFSFENMQAPTVLTKGRNLWAAAIREEARWANIPIVENPPLARSLYRTVEPGQPIPFELYSAVAGILAFLYRQKMEERVRRERTSLPSHAYRALTPGMRGVGGGM